MRFVESPLRPNLNLSQAEQLGYIYLPNEVFDKGVFLFMSEDGKFSTVKLKEEDLVMYRRCPSQGRDSALPMKVRRVETGVFSMRVPLDVCNMNNTDFDGDEAWVIKGGSKDGVAEMEAAWNREWVESGRESIYSKMTRLVNEVGGDPAMYTTMPLEDMIDHPGGEMDETLMLKPRSWRVMGMTTSTTTYWCSWGERSLDGIVNSAMGKHGIGKPYVQMRNSMMMGTLVVKDRKFIRVRSRDPQPIPAVIASTDMNSGSCSSALTRTTASLYQREIDNAKHGKDSSKVTAVETLMKRTNNCFAVVSTTSSRVAHLPEHELSLGPKWLLALGLDQQCHGTAVDTLRPPPFTGTQHVRYCS
jgi:hypothetical protein